MRRALFMAAVLGATALAGAPARADTDEQRAMTLFDKGRKLAREGRCNDAIPPLLESIRYAEGVGPLLNLGNCYETLGKLASAHRWFMRAQEVAASRDDLKRREEATQRARSIEKDISMLVIRVPASLKGSAEVRVDGEPWPPDRWETPAPIDPGVHEIELIAPPHPKQSESVTVRGKGDRVEWTAAGPPPTTRAPAAALAPAPRQISTRDDGATASATEPPSSTQRTLGLVTGGVGVVGLAAGAIFGVMSISAHSSVVGRCPTYPRCDIADRTALDDLNQSAERSGTISTIAVIAGAVLLVSGAALYFTAPSPRVAAQR